MYDLNILDLLKYTVKKNSSTLHHYYGKIESPVEC